MYLILVYGFKCSIYYKIMSEKQRWFQVINNNNRIYSKYKPKFTVTVVRDYRNIRRFRIERAAHLYTLKNPIESDEINCLRGCAHPLLTIFIDSMMYEYTLSLFRLII